MSVLLLLIGIIPILSAQGISPPTTVSFFVESPLLTQTSFIISGVVDSSEANYRGCVYVHLTDTISGGDSIENVHVNLGTSVGGNELFSGMFDYDNGMPLSANQYVSRVGLKMIIRIGLFSLLDLDSGDLYLEVKLEDSNNTLTVPTNFTYSFN
ncbi:MAG: hypothetical protein R3B93_19170 [Bacteroidia bacterium]